MTAKSKKLLTVYFRLDYNCHAITSRQSGVFKPALIFPTEVKQHLFLMGTCMKILFLSTSWASLWHKQYFSHYYSNSSNPFRIKTHESALMHICSGIEEAKVDSKINSISVHTHTHTHGHLPLPILQQEVSGFTLDPRKNIDSQSQHPFSHIQLKGECSKTQSSPPS